MRRAHRLQTFVRHARRRLLSTLPSRIPTVAYHFSFTAWTEDAAPAERSAPGAGVRDDDAEEAAERLGALVGRGLEFYRALAESASRIGGGARAVVRVGERVGRRGRRAGREAPGAPLPREPAASLRADTEESGTGGGESRLEAFARRADPLVLRERTCRALRVARAETRAVESRTAHDLRSLVHPLLLHVDKLRRTGGNSAEELKLLDDLIQSLVEWIEENLEEGSIVEEVRAASDARAGEAADVRAALEEALAGSDTDGLTVGVPDGLPGLAADRRLLEAGLRELLRLGRGAPRRLELDRDGDRVVRFSYELVRAPDSPRQVPSEAAPGGHPPVTGGLLNLAAWTGGTLRVAAGGGRDADAGAGPELARGAGGAPGPAVRVEVRLPASDPSTAAGGG